MHHTIKAENCFSETVPINVLSQIVSPRYHSQCLNRSLGGSTTWYQKYNQAEHSETKIENTFMYYVL